jgi:hypothetical protein
LTKRETVSGNLLPSKSEWKRVRQALQQLSSAADRRREHHDGEKLVLPADAAQQLKPAGAGLDIR